MKIAIIGSPGSGKSTFSVFLHKRLHLPLYHIDQYFWKSGWQKVDVSEFAKVHTDICNRPSWIIEGLATSYLEERLSKANVIIFLDVPRHVCLWRIFKRAFSNFGRVFFSSAQGCVEGFPSIEFLRYVWNFDTDKKPPIKNIIQKSGKTVFVASNNKHFGEILSVLQK